MFTKAFAVVGATLMLGAFAVTNDAYAQGPRLGSSYGYRMSPSGHLVVRGTTPNSGIRPPKPVNPVTGQNHFNAKPTRSTDFSASGPYMGLIYRGNQ